MMRNILLIVLGLVLLSSMVSASPSYAENTEVSYYPSNKHTDGDADLSRFRQLLEQDDDDKEEADDNEEDETEEGEGEDEEEEEDEEGEEKRNRPSEPEKEFEGLEKSLEQEDLRYEKLGEGMENDQPSRNMHIVSDDATEDSKEKELLDALQAVKDQIVFKANSVKSQKRWTRQVAEIIKTYVTKSQKVNKSTRELQAEIKELFRKKKQIANMLVQRKLEKKLKFANGDLQLLMAAMAKTREKEQAFKDSQDSIRSTIGSIESMLAKLRSEPDPHADKAEDGAAEKK